MQIIQTIRRQFQPNIGDCVASFGKTRDKLRTAISRNQDMIQDRLEAIEDMENQIEVSETEIGILAEENEAGERIIANLTLLTK